MQNLKELVGITLLRNVMKSRVITVLEHLGHWESGICFAVGLMMVSLFRLNLPNGQELKRMAK